MKPTILLAVLLVASGMLLSSCGHSFNFVPMDSHRPEPSSAKQVTEKPASQERNVPVATESKSPNTVSLEQRMVERSDDNRTTAPAAETRASAEPHSVIDAIPNRTAAKKAALNVENSPQGQPVIAAEIGDTQSAAPAVQAPLSPNSSGGVPKWFLVVCSILLPPLAVALVFGISDKFWICLALTLCFWIPGVIYALIQVL